MTTQNRFFIPITALYLLIFSTPHVFAQSGADAAQPRNAERQGIIMGTDSPDIFHYYDEETQTEVWGVRPTPRTDSSPPPPPIWVQPEINLPWQPGTKFPGQTVKPGRPPAGARP